MATMIRRSFIILIFSVFGIIYGAVENVRLFPATTSYEVDEGASIPSINCSADCSPPCRYYWKYQLRVHTQGSVLSLQNVDRMDTGVYECTAEETSGDYKIAGIYVKVLYGPVSVNFVPANTSYKRNEFTFVPEIMCTADCDPPCTFTWIMPGWGVRYTSPSLQLNQLDRREEGVYTCLAKNRISEKTATISVEVNYGPGNSLKISPDVTQYIVMENTTINDVICSANCKPQCKITWDYQCSSDLHVLSFTEIHRDQARLYTCTAGNVAGSANISVQIKVKYPTELHSLKITSKDPVIKEGNSATIVCIVDGVPISNVIWTYLENGTILKKDNSTSRSFLALKKTSCLDTGTYRCSAYNGIGKTVFRNIFLSVNCKPRIDERTSKKYINYLSLGTDGGIDISVQIVAFPAPNVTWYIQRLDSNQTEIINTSIFTVITTYKDYDVSIRLKKTVLSGKEFGKYIVYVENSLGSINVSFIVVPHGPPDPPYELKVQCIPSHKALLSWKPGFNRGDEQMFYMKYRESYSDYKRLPTIIEDSGDVISEEVDVPVTNVVYLFTVVSVNKYGSTLSREEVNCTSKDSQRIEDTGPSDGVVVAATLVASVVIVIVVLIVVVCYRKRKAVVRRRSRRDPTVRMRKKSSEVVSSVKITISRPSDEFDDFDSGPYHEIDPPSGSSNYYLDLNVGQPEAVYEDMNDSNKGLVYDEPD